MYYNGKGNIEATFLIEVKQKETWKSTTYLVVNTWVRDNKKAGLLESLLDLVSEGTRGESTSNGVGAGEVREL